MDKDKMASCCICPKSAAAETPSPTNTTTTTDKVKTTVPLICLVPCNDTKPEKLGPDKPGKTDSHKPNPTASHKKEDVQFIDINHLRKHFKFPSRPLYLDPFRRPLITFPMTQEGRGVNFNVDRKAKINQQILDGFLDPSEAIFAPSIFPHSTKVTKKKDTDEDEEIVYILQLPDLETKCPVHNEIIKTPRFIWHSCKKTSKHEEKNKSNEMKKGPGPKHKPKPWLLSRHTDFDLASQW